MNDIYIKQHLFQTAGLGLAPYKFLGVTENRFTQPGVAPRAGGACDYCGTNIRYEFHLESVDKKQFKVGSDCICKAGDAGLAIHVASHKTKLRRAAALARKHALIAKKIALIDEILLFLENNSAILKQTSHPWGGWDYSTNAPRNWFDYGVWMARHCGIPALQKLQAEAKNSVDLFIAAHP